MQTINCSTKWLLFSCPCIYYIHCDVTMSTLYGTCKCIWMRPTGKNYVSDIPSEGRTCLLAPVSLSNVALPGMEVRTVDLYCFWEDVIQVATVEGWCFDTQYYNATCVYYVLERHSDWEGIGCALSLRLTSTILWLTSITTAAITSQCLRVHVGRQMWWWQAGGRKAVSIL